MFFAKPKRRGWRLVPWQQCGRADGRHVRFVALAGETPTLEQGERDAKAHAKASKAYRLLLAAPVLATSLLLFSIAAPVAPARRLLVPAC